MVLLNTKTGESFSNVSKAEIARQIGISWQTVYNWEKSLKRAENPKEYIEYYNYWIIGLKEIKLKQQKGFAL